MIRRLLAPLRDWLYDTIGCTGTRQFPDPPQPGDVVRCPECGAVRNINPESSQTRGDHHV